MLDCKHASHLVSQSMDRPLRWRERLGLSVHLAMCGMCRQFLSQLRLIRGALRRMVNQAEEDVSVKLPEEAHERIRKALEKLP